MHTKNVLVKGFAAALMAVAAGTAQATLFTSNFGSLLPGYTPNDDSSYQVTLPFSFNYFGNSYNTMSVNNNGYVLFGTSANPFGAVPVTTETIGPMIAPYWTDLTSVSDPLDPIAAATGGSGVYYNQVSPTQVVVTWDRLGYFPANYSGRAQFQLVLNDANAALPANQGAIGFYYGGVTSGTDNHQVAVGLGDGLPSINPGEVSFTYALSSSVAPSVSDVSVPNVRGGAGPAPNGPGALPEPPSLALFGIGAAGLGAARLRRRRAAT